MRGRIAAAGSVVLFSLLLTFVLGEDNATLNSIDYENEEEETLVEQEDLVMEDAEYEYAKRSNATWWSSTNTQAFMSLIWKAFFTLWMRTTGTFSGPGK